MSIGVPAASIVAPDQSSFYTPLPSATSFRLLHFKNADTSTDDLVCNLEVHEISQAPPYRALSYTWGQPYYSKSRGEKEALQEFTLFYYWIRCNGRVFRMTKNLFNALTTLVNTLELEYLWVDAICINQTDIEIERPQQVRLMGRIYTSADEVLMWLGHHVLQAKEFHWSATVFADAVERVVAERGEQFLITRSLMSNELVATLGLNDSLAKFREPLEFYRKCRIFDRAWILPEIVTLDIHECSAVSSRYHGK